MEEHTVRGDHVQIHASKDEMLARISAFCSRKRSQIDERNIEAFCGSKQARLDPQQVSTSCARIDAILFPTYNKSRFKVNSVYNKEGPQLNHGAQANTDQQQVKDTQVGVNVEGRLRDMEVHCNLTEAAGQSVVQRIRSLEDRILYLEGISLEYFNNSQTRSILQKPSSEVADDSNKLEGDNSKRDRVEELSLPQIDERIEVLKRKLKVKAMEQG